MTNIIKNNNEENITVACSKDSSYPDELAINVAECAYYKAEKRGFAPGHEIEDWYEAEKEILESLSQSSRAFGIGLKQ